MKSFYIAVLLSIILSSCSLTQTVEQPEKTVAWELAHPPVNSHAINYVQNFNIDFDVRFEPVYSDFEIPVPEYESGFICGGIRYIAHDLPDLDTRIDLWLIGAQEHWVPIDGKAKQVFFFDFRK